MAKKTEKTEGEESKVEEPQVEEFRVEEEPEDRLTAPGKTFEPRKYFMRLQGKDYLPVAARVAWFRADHPDWCIETKAEVLDLEKEFAMFKATISRPCDAGGEWQPTETLATGHKTETRKGFTDYVEKAEAGAIGRALAYLGYGTLCAQELEESDGKVVDAPQSSQPYAGGKSNAGPSGTNASPSGEYKCSKCGKSITKARAEMCERSGKPITCPPCAG